MNKKDLLKIAKQTPYPHWATHIAVRNDGSKSEPAAWVDEVNDYLDEGPSELGRNCWA